MADIVKLRPRTPPLPRLLDGPQRPPAQLASRRIVAGWRQARTFDRLDDHLLRDIGVGRDEVQPILFRILAANQRLWRW
ncbi:MAG TPA: DUF1127 domain-containing protein [Dongiaceae bacterium]|nr:DUF1127 domain-containing protein [Dongiaceae bacterium]